MRFSGRFLLLLTALSLTACSGDGPLRPSPSSEIAPAAVLQTYGGQPPSGWLRPYALHASPADGSMFVFNVAQPAEPTIDHLDASGRRIGSWPVQGTITDLDMNADGLVYALTSESSLLIYSQNGSLVGNLPLSPHMESTDRVRSLVVDDSSGDVFVLTQQKILHLSSDGSYVGDESGWNGWLLDITLGADGNVAALNEGTHSIDSLSPTGAVVRSVPMPAGTYGSWIVGADDGYFLLTGRGDLFFVDLTGHLRFQGGLDSHGYHYVFDPSGMALASDGTLLVADLQGGRISRFSVSLMFLGELRPEVPAEGTLYVPSAQWGPDGSVYLMDLGLGRVVRYDAQGRALVAWGENGERMGQFGSSARIEAAPNGDMYESDERRIQRFSPSGELTAVWPTKGARYLAVTGDGTVAVAEGRSLYLFRSDLAPIGRVEASPYTGSLLFRSILDLAGGPADWVYVLDSYYWHVIAVDRTGAVKRQVRIRPRSGSTFSFRLEVGPRGTIYVSNVTSGTVDVYDPEGRFAGTWTETALSLDVDASGNILAAEGRLGTRSFSPIPLPGD